MPGQGQQVGYVRVSSSGQNASRQLEGIALEKTFSDELSGKSLQRPQLEAMLAYVREGDTVFVHSLDRLARNLDDLRKIVLGLTSRGICVRFVKEGLEFTGDDAPLSKMLLSIVGAFAEFERELIRERQREGIAIAKAKGGVYRGRKPSLSTEQIHQLKQRVQAGERKAELARQFNISRETLYAYLRTGPDGTRKPRSQKQVGGRS